MWEGKRTKKNPYSCVCGSLIGTKQRAVTERILVAGLIQPQCHYIRPVIVNHKTRPSVCLGIITHDLDIIDTDW